ncbi:hypothetical protein [Streptomyces sp. NPDC004783]|uniref:hypothetical protein n=1 Tax=Streptomyces sp. NPDC004783 TaxID=3154459 RepID=UPI0033A59E81
MSQAAVTAALPQIYTGLLVVLTVPAVIGMFWGTPPISRELETRTHYLAWNQGVTRTRWLVTKLVLGAAASMTAGRLTGQPANVPSSFADCLRTESGPAALQQVDRCVADLGALGYMQQVTYQPAGNFDGRPQGSETAHLTPTHTATRTPTQGRVPCASPTSNAQSAAPDRAGGLSKTPPGRRHRAPPGGNDSVRGP